MDLDGQILNGFDICLLTAALKLSLGEHSIPHHPT